MSQNNDKEERNQNVDEDDIIIETSPESAALVRGASRSVASAGKGTIVGRLPSQSKAASKAISKAPRIRAVARQRHVPRSMPRAPRGSARLAGKIPKGRRSNTIAKVSDRASSIFDVVSAGSESNNDEKNVWNNNSKQHHASFLQQKMKAMLPTFQQAITFSRVFAVNTVLGMAVYGTYEGLIDQYASENTTFHNEQNNGLKNTMHNFSEELMDESNDTMEHASLPQHFLAGSLGGTSHAILSLGLEMKLLNKSAIPEQGMTKKPNNTLVMNRFHLQYPTMVHSISTVFHHSMAHAILFGSYQTTKRLLLSNDTLSLSNDDKYYDISHAAVISTAGGIAGQLQHVASHFSEQYLGISGSRAASLRHLTWPTLRSTLLAFPISSIGFVAFEYGRVLMNVEEKNDPA